ncbi:hypothetical protein GX586_13540 [bacterium]|nr:hypothetical protein [bacterium]
MKHILACSMLVTSVALAAGVIGQFSDAAYNRVAHDDKANTLAIVRTKNGSEITACSVSILNAKGELVAGPLPFSDALGGEDIFIEFFGKDWAILRVDGGTDTFYSVTVGSKGVTVLGSATETEFDFNAVIKTKVVSYIKNPDSLCRMFDRNLAPLDPAVQTVGSPDYLSKMKYFRCSGVGTTQVWRVKAKGFEKTIEQPGQWHTGGGLPNEQKRLCCIEDDDIHTLCKY